MKTFKEILNKKIEHYGKTEAAYEFAAEEFSNINVSEQIKLFKEKINMEKIKQEALDYSALDFNGGCNLIEKRAFIQGALFVKNMID